MLIYVFTPEREVIRETESLLPTAIWPTILKDSSAQHVSKLQVQKPILAGLLCLFRHRIVPFTNYFCKEMVITRRKLAALQQDSAAAVLDICLQHAAQHMSAESIARLWCSSRALQQLCTSRLDSSVLVRSVAAVAQAAVDAAAAAPGPPPTLGRAAAAPVQAWKSMEALHWLLRQPAVTAGMIMQSASSCWPSLACRLLLLRPWCVQGCARRSRASSWWQQRMTALRVLRCGSRPSLLLECQKRSGRLTCLKHCGWCAYAPSANQSWWVQ
jgi:hypothetical protein